MALHETHCKRPYVDIAFCDVHSPWQRDSNENANGLIREFQPKGMDLNQISHRQLTTVGHALNHRPRKIPCFPSPDEIVSQFKQDLLRVSHVNLEANQSRNRLNVEYFNLRIFNIF